MPTYLSRVLTAMLLLVFGMSTPIYSETSNDLVSNLDYIENGLVSLQQEIRNLDNYIETLETQIDEINNNLLRSEQHLERSHNQLEQQKRLLNRLSKQLDESERQLQDKSQEYNLRLAGIARDHRAEVESLESEVLLWKIVAGVVGAVSIASATYAILK